MRYPCLIRLTYLFWLSFFLFVVTGYTSSLHAQGCSDAGICSISSFKPGIENIADQYRNELSFGLSTGSADNAISVFGANLGYSRKFGTSFSLDSKVTFLSQSGNGISETGMGDIFINLNHMVSTRTTLTLGTKIPLSSSDKMLNGHALPMDYQSSLGTLDGYVGISYRHAKWRWVLALQQPLAQNENGFLPESFLPDSTFFTFQGTNSFNRKGDLILRVSHPIMQRGKFLLTLGLLPIYHLGKDQFTDSNGQVQSIQGSDGLTINGNVFAKIGISSSSDFDFNVGFPFLVRKARPDGLTRGYVMAATYAVKF